MTAGKLRATILSDNMVGAGVHINAVGGDCPGKTELQRERLLRADVFVEFPEEMRIEGEIQQMAANYPVTELWRVIAGQAPGRQSERQTTIVDSVGFAIEDFSALRLVMDKVQGTDFYSHLNRLAESADPRNLFGLLSSDAGRIPLPARRNDHAFSLRAGAAQRRHDPPAPFHPQRRDR